MVEVTRDRVDGTEEIVGRFEPGEYFGELAPTFGLQRSAGASGRLLRLEGTGRILVEQAAG